MSLKPFPPVNFKHPRIIANPFLEPVLRFGGDENEMLIEPSDGLEPWWAVFKRDGDPAMVKRVMDYIERCSASPWAKSAIESMIQAPRCSFSASSACRRGYKGTWTIQDRFLHLAHLSLQWGQVLDGPQPVRATWVTGRFIGEYGREIAGGPMCPAKREHAKSLVFVLGRLVRYSDVPVGKVEAGSRAIPRRRWRFW